MQDQTPRQIDEKLAEAEYAWMGLEISASNLRGIITRDLERHGASFSTRIDRMQRELAEIGEKQEPFRAIIDEANAEFTRRGGWRRYFLVVNSNGHVHRERSCSTCYPTTQYAWLPALSDCNEAAMVAEYGSDACSVCSAWAWSIAVNCSAIASALRPALA